MRPIRETGQGRIWPDVFDMFWGGLSKSFTWPEPMEPTRHLNYPRKFLLIVLSSAASSCSSSASSHVYWCCPLPKTNEEIKTHINEKLRKVHILEPWDVMSTSTLTPLKGVFSGPQEEGMVGGRWGLGSPPVQKYTKMQRTYEGKGYETTKATKITKTTKTTTRTTTKQTCPVSFVSRFWEPVDKGFWHPVDQGFWHPTIQFCRF